MHHFIYWLQTSAISLTRHSCIFHLFHKNVYSCHLQTETVILITSFDVWTEKLLCTSFTESTCYFFLFCLCCPTRELMLWLKQLLTERYAVYQKKLKPYNLFLMQHKFIIQLIACSKINWTSTKVPHPQDRGKVCDMCSTALWSFGCIGSWGLFPLSPANHTLLIALQC